MWHMVGSEHSIKISEQKDHSMNEWINHKGFYRTARATPAGAFWSAQNCQKMDFPMDFQKVNWVGWILWGKNSEKA